MSVAGLLVAGVPQTSNAATTKIIFPKGSYCGSYSGDYRHNKTFSVYLMKGQTFQITTDNELDTMNVRGPAGHLEGDWSNEGKTYTVTTHSKGLHYVTLHSKADFANLKFCAS